MWRFSASAIAQESHTSSASLPAATSARYASSESAAMAIGSPVCSRSWLRYQSTARRTGPIAVSQCHGKRHAPGGRGSVTPPRAAAPTADRRTVGRTCRPRPHWWVHVARRGTRGEAAALHWCAASSPTTTTAPTPLTTSPPTPTRNSSPPGWSVSLNAVRTLCRRVGRPTGTGKSRPRRCWLSSSGGSNSTSAAANTGASITGWISNHRGITEKCGGPLGRHSR